MKKTTCEYPLKPVVIHRNKGWQPMRESDPEVNLRRCACGTEWRHCPIVADCDWNADCERIPAFITISEDVKVMEDIDLIAGSGLKLITDHGQFTLVRTAYASDRELLLAWLAEADKVERTHIITAKFKVLDEMLSSRGYESSVHDVRQRLR